MLRQPPSRNNPRQAHYQVLDAIFLAMVSCHSSELSGQDPILKMLSMKAMRNRGGGWLCSPLERAEKDVYAARLVCSDAKKTLRKLKKQEQGNLSTELLEKKTRILHTAEEQLEIAQRLLKSERFFAGSNQI